MEIFSDEQKKAALIEEITAAFDGVSREDGVTLHEAMALDNYGGFAERQKARAQDTEDRWQDVPDEDIRSSDAVLNFLDSKGFHYYIPAFVVWYIRNADNDDPEFYSNVFDSVLFHLSASIYEEVEDYYLSRFKLLTLEQAKSIAHFLEFEAEGYDASKIEFKQWRQESMFKEGSSQEEIDAAQFSMEHNFPENEARRALKRYWGQFV